MVASTFLRSWQSDHLGNNSSAKSLFLSLLHSNFSKSRCLCDTHHLLMSDCLLFETEDTERASSQKTIATGRESNVEFAATERCHWLLLTWQLKIMVDLQACGSFAGSTRLGERNAIGPRLTFLPTSPTNVVLERLC